MKLNVLPRIIWSVSVIGWQPTFMELTRAWSHPQNNTRKNPGKRYHDDSVSRILLQVRGRRVFWNISLQNLTY